MVTIENCGWIMLLDVTTKTPQLVEIQHYCYLLEWKYSSII